MSKRIITTISIVLVAVAIGIAAVVITTKNDPGETEVAHDRNTTHPSAPPAPSGELAELLLDPWENATTPILAPEVEAKITETTSAYCQESVHLMRSDALRCFENSGSSQSLLHDPCIADPTYTQAVCENRSGPGLLRVIIEPESPAPDAAVPYFDEGSNPTPSEIEAEAMAECLYGPGEPVTDERVAECEREVGSS